MAAGGVETFWFDRYQDSQQRVLAACRAAGEVTGILTPGPWNDAERLIRIGDVLRELRQELGLPDHPGLASQAISTTTNADAGTNGEDD